MSIFYTVILKRKTATKNLFCYPKNIIYTAKIFVGANTQGEKKMIEIIKTIFYGILEGITEWLPISSTGHLIILNNIWPMAVSKEFWSMFEVVVQLGAIMAVVFL